MSPPSHCLPAGAPEFADSALLLLLPGAAAKQGGTDFLLHIQALRHYLLVR